MDDCVFCKIVKKEIPSQIAGETEDIIVFEDINPKAPIHLLIVPKKHIRDITDDNGRIWTEVRKMATKLANEKGIKGFRLVHNVGEAAVVHHMHVHFLADIAADREV
jgi:histidine triad (HIT) family protein